MFARTFVMLATVAIGASAAAIPDQCRNVLLGILQNSDASACLNTNGLFSAVFSSLNATSDLVPPINTWAQGVCSAPACSDSTVESLVRNITTGCSDAVSTMVKDKGVTLPDVDKMVEEAKKGYPVLRSVLCLKDTTKNELCVQETLSSVQAAVGTTLSVADMLVLLATDATGTASALTANNVTCTKCTQAAFQIVQGNYSDLVSGDVKNKVQQQCGADFISGPMPSEIQQTATNAVGSPSTGKNGATALGSPRTVVGALAAVAVGAAAFL